MKRLMLIVALAAGMVLAVAHGQATADPYQRRVQVYRPPVPHWHGTAHPNPLGHRVSPYHAQRYYGHSWYPRHYGAFHARYFQDMGFPSGDRPLRGTAW